MNEIMIHKDEGSIRIKRHCHICGKICIVSLLYG